MLYSLVIAVHVIACLVLIAVILLQAGRGGGLSEAFGGSSTQTIFGTKANVFLSRATTTCAVLYIITCLLLVILTSKRGRSLIQLRGPMPQAQEIPYEAKPSLPPAEPEPPPKQ